MGGVRGTSVRRRRALTADRSLTFIVPGDLSARTGGYGYDRRLIAALRERDWHVAVVALDASFPTPTPAARAHAASVLAGIADGAVVVIDGLAFGALADEAEHERHRLRLVALVHHPLALETGLHAETAAGLRASERRALATTRLVVVTSRTTAATLADYDVPPRRIVVIEPGTDPAPAARGSHDRDGVFRLLCVASITPRKDHATLVDALAVVGGGGWQLRCAGGVDRDSATAAALLQKIRQAKLTDRVVFLGELDEPAVAGEYDAADLFVLPTRYEGYGMAVAEALARGVPIISTPTGAIADLVGSDAGILVPPGDSQALADALSRFMDDAALRARLRDGARRARSRLQAWSTAGARMIAAVERVSG